MSRPTFDELRERAGTLAAQGGRYADVAGSGPDGKTCRSCKHKTYSGWNTKHPKCGLTKWTHGDATTIKTSTPACRKYEDAA